MKYRLAGVALVCAAVALVVMAYAGKPDASTCRVVNSINPGACSSSPSAPLMWAALVIGLTGIALQFIARRRA